MQTQKGKGKGKKKNKVLILPSSLENKGRKGETHSDLQDSVSESLQEK